MESNLLSLFNEEDENVRKAVNSFISKISTKSELEFWLNNDLKQFYGKLQDDIKNGTHTLYTARLNLAKLFGFEKIAISQNSNGENIFNAKFANTIFEYLKLNPFTEQIYLTLVQYGNQVRFTADMIAMDDCNFETNPRSDAIIPSYKEFQNRIMINFKKQSQSQFNNKKLPKEEELCDAIGDLIVELKKNWDLFLENEKYFLNLQNNLKKEYFPNLKSQEIIEQSKGKFSPKLCEILEKILGERYQINLEELSKIMGKYRISKLSTNTQTQNLNTCNEFDRKQFQFNN